MNVAQVIVDVSLDRVFDYAVPEVLADAVQVGSQVVIPFGRREARGYVVGLAGRSDVAKLKEIRGVVGRKALVRQNVMDLARWVGEYYVAPLEHAVRTVLPAAVRRRGARFKERLFVSPGEAAADAGAVAKLRKKAPKQAAALDVLLAKGSVMLHELVAAAGTDRAAVHALERKGFARVGRQAVPRDPHANVEILRTTALDLMPQQANALSRVRRSIDTGEPPVVLLFGVTGSGKTEVYLQAIDHAMSQDKGCIVLVPEIALTPQTVDRFRSRFGDCVAVLHSELSDGERHDEWHRINDGSARIAIGPRSAVFAPVRNLGLIVVDEEHEQTYKQEESPRYHARDVAVMRGRMEPCAVVLGSATPSMESLFNAKRGKYEMLRMPHRVDHQRMPGMRIVDMRAEMEREGRINVLSRDLCNAIQERIQRAEQSILFLNRRGYATSLVCPKCGEVASCENCSVAMTYHKPTNRLLCHLCGAAREVPSRCPNRECQDPSFRYAGMGTQRVEDVVAKIFPKARIRRMDSDSMTAKDSYRSVLGDFRTGKIDILVGTQMIAKGLDFPNVTLVGVIYADLSLHMPDFRAGERTFQLLTQVAGRAGRGDIVGEVIVQTFSPFHPAIQAARRLDYDGFYDQEIEFRRELSYPPFTHLVCITLRGVNEDLVAFTALTLLRKLKPDLAAEVTVGEPTPAPIAKAKGEYRYQVILRAPRTGSVTEPLKALLKKFTWPEAVSWSVDVDAVSLL
jgi:primosomal protein N' (replication factor Y) (superfamily II helicase)